MSKTSLDILFDSKVRVKILKYIFRNMDRSYAPRDIAKHIQEDQLVVRRELQKLYDIKLLRRL